MMSQPPPPPPGYTQPPPPGYSQYSQPVPPGYPQPPMGSQAMATNVVIAQPMARPVMLFREMPVQCQCPACQASIVTSTSYESGTMTWVVCLVLALFGLWIGCCLIPFCINGCKDVVHSCPQCRHTIGRYNRM